MDLVQGNPTEVKVVLASAAMALAIMCLSYFELDSREERLDQQEERREDREDR